MFAQLGRGSFTPTDLGAGAIVSASVLSEPFAPTHCTTRETCYNFFLLRYRPGTDLNAATAQLNRLAAILHCPVTSCAVTTDQRPGDIKNYAAIQNTPLVLGGVLVVTAMMFAPSLARRTA